MLSRRVAAPRRPRVCATIRPAAHYGWSDKLILIAIILATGLLLTVMCWHVARRLFGVRIPFAARLLETTPPYGAAELLEIEAELLDLKRRVAGMTAKD